MIRPIPKRMLKNEVKYKKINSDQGEGITYSDEITLFNVKVEEKKEYKRTNDGVEIVGNAIMFYDLTNSKGLNEEPIVHSIIEFGNKIYHIVDTETLRGNNNQPHHYEVILK